MRVKLTKALVEKTPPDKLKDLYLWDSETPGFALKITPKGKRVYVVQYRVTGVSRRVAIGRHGILTIDQARDAAKTKLAEAELGGDPAEAKISLRRGPTIRDLGARYLTEHAALKKKESSADDDSTMLERHIYPAIGSLKVASVTRGQIADLHHGMKDKRYAANRVLSLLSKMFNLAEAWGYRPLNTNPCAHIERFKEQKRKRFLSVEELARLGQVMSVVETDGSEPQTAIDAIRMLIFTGCRVNEILTAQWPYVDWDMQVLILPDSKTGSKTIPLSAPAIQTLKSRPVIEGNPYIFQGYRTGQHFVGLFDVWQRIREKAGIPDVRLHDLRHSYASVGAAAGLGLPIIGALLGHADAATTQRYAHLATDPLKAAAEAIASRIDEAMKKDPKKLRRVK